MNELGRLVNAQLPDVTKSEVLYFQVLCAVNKEGKDCFESNEKGREEQKGDPPVGTLNGRHQLGGALLLWGCSTLRWDQDQAVQ